MGHNHHLVHGHLAPVLNLFLTQGEVSRVSSSMRVGPGQDYWNSMEIVSFP